MERYKNLTPGSTLGRSPLDEQLQYDPSQFSSLLPNQKPIPYGQEIRSGRSNNHGGSQPAASLNLTRVSTPVNSVSGNVSDGVSHPGVQFTNAVLQWFMVFAVLGACVFMAVKNNQEDIIFNLTSLAFGYYFGQRQEVTKIIK